jgi:uncharacterized membrane-anchored protein
MSTFFTYLILICGLVLPQLLLREYSTVITIWILVGVVTGFVAGSVNVFLKSFIVQVIIGIILFGFVAAEGTAYLQQIPESFGMPGFLIIAVAVLFNALNAAFCILAGTILISMVFPSRFRTRKYVNIYR